MLLPSGNPFKCHEEVLYFQLLIPPKRFDIFSPRLGDAQKVQVHSDFSINLHIVAYLFSITCVFFLFILFSRTLCTVPVSLISILPPCRPQYGNHSTNLPFGNDEHTLYKTIISEQCLQYTKKSSRKRLQPLGKKKNRRCRVCICSSFFMLNLLIQQPNYIHTRSTKKRHILLATGRNHPAHLQCESYGVYHNNEETQKKNRTLASSIPANTTLGCKLNTCSDRRGSSCFSGAPAFYEVKSVQSCSKMRHDECGMIAPTTRV